MFWVEVPHSFQMFGLKCTSLGLIWNQNKKSGRILGLGHSFVFHVFLVSGGGGAGSHFVLSGLGSPYFLPAGGGRPQFLFSDGGGSVSVVSKQGVPHSFHLIKIILHYLPETSQKKTCRAVLRNANVF